MRARLLAVLALALLGVVLAGAHMIATDADGPDGLSDNSDLDDLLLRLTSPTAAAPSVGVGIAPCSVAIDAVVLPATNRACSVVRPSVGSRAPPLA
jgi:hypothetical protein